MHFSRYSIASVSLGQAHVQRHFSRGLRTSHDKVELATLPTKDQGENQKKPHGLPGHYWFISVPVVDTMNLVTSMHVKSCLPFIYLLCFNFSLSPHRPHHVEQPSAGRHFVQQHGLVVAHFFVPIQFNTDRFDELISIRGLHGLVPVQYVRVSDRIPSTTPGAEPPRDAKDSGSARSHSTHLETSSSNRP